MRQPGFWQTDTWVSDLLAPLAFGYDFVRRRLGRGQAPRKVSVPVICVGNLTAGGAGKTPAALSLGRLLAAKGCKVHFLTRGYRGREKGSLQVDPSQHSADDVGDEALLLAAAAPTWVARNRVAGAEAAIRSGAGVIVMDDGFQNHSLARDLSVLVIDGPYGLGNRRLLPAGPLREPVDGGLARADAVVIVGEDRQGWSRRCPEGQRLLRAALHPAEGAQELKSRRLYAFAGIARPEKFFDTLQDLGAEVAGRRRFPDHHRYQAWQIDQILEEAAALKATAITTEKDAVKIDSDRRRQLLVLPVELTWEDPAQLEALLAKVWPHG